MTTDEQLDRLEQDVRLRLVPTYVMLSEQWRAQEAVLDPYHILELIAEVRRLRAALGALAGPVKGLRYAIDFESEGVAGAAVAALEEIEDVLGLGGGA